MCCPNTAFLDNKRSIDAPPAKWSQLSRFRVHPLLLVALLPLFPTGLYLNRGYTIWFHWFSLAALVTQSSFLRKFAILQGSGISLGWYAAMVYEWMFQGNFFHILYKNSPIFLRQHMVDENGTVIWDTPESLVCRLVSHTADIVAHPVLAYWLWRWHVRASGSGVLDWSVIVLAYACSRLWSIVHTTYNMGEPGLFYMGHEVYNVDSLDVWIAPYIAEGVIYALAVFWKLVLEEPPESAKVSDALFDAKPKLIESESDLSTDTCPAR